MRFLGALYLSIILTCVAVSSPLSYAHIFCSPSAVPLPNAVSPPISYQSIYINEVMSKPISSSFLNCTDHTLSPQVELFNPSAQAYDLGSVFAALNNSSGLPPYYLPHATSIASHGYLVLFLPDSFPLQGTLRLLFQGSLIDEVTLPDLGADQSYARMPDGSSNWQIINAPTLGASNTSASGSPTTEPSLIPMATPTSTQTISSPKQGNRVITGTSKANTQSTNVSTHTTSAQQPIWNNLHFPAISQSSLSASSPPASLPAPRAAHSQANLFLPFLIGILALLMLTLSASFFFWRKRQQKAP